MNDTSYNGWTNYETWCVNLWLTNDQGTAEYWEEAAISAVEQHEDKAVRNLADMMQQEIMEQSPLEECSMYQDLMGAAFCEVNWREIAEHFVESARERVDTAEQRRSE